MGYWLCARIYTTFRCHCHCPDRRPVLELQPAAESIYIAAPLPRLRVKDPLKLLVSYVHIIFLFESECSCLDREFKETTILHRHPSWTWRKIPKEKERINEMQ